MHDQNHAVEKPTGVESVLEIIHPDHDKMVLNVGGIRHETLVRTLSSKPDTRLGELALRHHFNRADEYFFDRNPEVFNAVIDYYRSGELHIPMAVCGVVIRRELEYWNLKETLIHPCCWVHYCTNVDRVEALEKLNKLPVQEQRENDDMLTFKGLAKFRLSIWRLMCRPNSTKYAKVYSIVSMLFVMAAITGCCLETVPPLQDTHYARKTLDSCRNPDVTTPHPDVTTLDHNVTTLSPNATDSFDHNPFQRLLPQPIYALRIIDYICNCFFSVELLTRLIVAPEPLTFIKSPITIIDIVAIIPFYLMLLLDVIYRDPCVRDKRALFLHIVFVLRIVRVFRVFQMLAYFKPLKILVRALRDSVYELLILFVFIIICMLVFATLAFYAEINNEESNFTTIPIGFWWAIVTITTVGYGDIYPRTIAGYFVGAACALCGTVIMALTIPILSNNFTLYYTHSRTRERANVKEKLRESQLQQEEQSGGTKKSVVDDGTIIFTKPRTKSTAAPSPENFERDLTFRRESQSLKSDHELNPTKIMLVGHGGSLQTRSQEKVVVVHGAVSNYEGNGTRVEPFIEETDTSTV